MRCCHDFSGEFRGQCAPCQGAPRGGKADLGAHHSDAEEKSTWYGSASPRAIAGVCWLVAALIAVAVWRDESWVLLLSVALAIYGYFKFTWDQRLWQAIQPRELEKGYFGGS